jgi:hypothetical protein
LTGTVWRSCETDEPEVQQKTRAAGGLAARETQSISISLTGAAL